MKPIGKLNAEKSNAILILHAFSGDAHVSGEGGWWSNLVGSGKGIDTDKYFVICSNVLGGCQGSTGPSSINPKTGQTIRFGFSVSHNRRLWLTLNRRLIDHLGIEQAISGRWAVQWAACRFCNGWSLSRPNSRSSSHCDDAEAYASANRLQRGWTTSSHG